MDREAAIFVLMLMVFAIFSIWSWFDLRHVGVLPWKVIERSNNGNCSYYFALPIGNNSLGDGVALNRGIYGEVGTPPHGQPEGKKLPF